jgi:DNA-binding NtrC family response regulator
MIFAATLISTTKYHKTQKSNRVSSRVFSKVNDNTDLVELFKTALEHQGIQTYTFTDPTLALKKIKPDPNTFHLIIINYASQLKQYRGKFAKEVKAVNENIKVVLTSGYNFSAVEISNNGYDKFLQLPVKLSTLVSTVKEMLNTLN